MDAGDGRTNGPEQVSLLTALRIGDVPARRRAPDELGKLPIAADAVLTGLVTALMDTDAAVRVAAARALQRLGMLTEPVLVGLVATLYDPIPSVRGVAAEALGEACGRPRLFY